MKFRYRLEIADHARKDFKKLPKPDKRRMIAKLKSFRVDPRPDGYKKLEGMSEKFYRVHVGRYRIIYQIKDSIVTVLVLRFLKRDESTYKS